MSRTRTGTRTGTVLVQPQKINASLFFFAMIVHTRTAETTQAWRRRKTRGSHIIMLALFFLLCCCRTGQSFVPPSSSRTNARSMAMVTTSAIPNGAKPFEKMTVAELKDILRSRDLPVSGTKDKLVKRLLEYQDAAVEQTPTEDAVASLLPPPLAEALVQQTGTSHLLPIQERAFQPIASGSDAVLFSPTGTGKTLGYILPLFTRLAPRKKRLSQKDYFDRRNQPCCPSILILTPSRELAKQVGKVCAQFRSSSRVATVFGGVPLERHSSLLRKDLDVVVGTPGRMRELMREGFLSTESVESIVLDEADVLLNFEDQPEIEMLLNGMENDYQLVLASATVNSRVKEFVKEAMEIDPHSDAFCVEKSVNGQETTRPTVHHWCTAARSSARSGLALDIVTTLSPRVALIFVATKAEAEAVSDEMADRLRDMKVSVLHGDLAQSARSRTVAALRQKTKGGKGRILVATDVASRGLDLPAVDLVLQFGIPRRQGRDGTCDSELYTHRAGRAGRVGGGSRPADAILLYDPAEKRLLPELQADLEDVGIHLQPRPLPSPSDVMEASYIHARGVCSDFAGDADFVSFFRNKIESEVAEMPADDRHEYLMNQLAAATAALSGLDGAVPERSLLTADTKDRTIRVWTDDSERLNPAEVTEFVKGLGSGKLGRVSMLEDGSALFDLSEKRTLQVLRAAQEQSETNESLSSKKMYLELVNTLPQVV